MVVGLCFPVPVVKSASVAQGGELRRSGAGGKTELRRCEMAVHTSSLSFKLCALSAPVLGESYGK